MRDTARIQVNLPGSEPDHIEGVSAFVLLTIPKENPSDDSQLRVAGMTPEMVAECGAYLISVARAMKTGKAPTPLGAAMNRRDPGQIIIPKDPFLGISNKN